MSKGKKLFTTIQTAEALGMTRSRLGCYVADKRIVMPRPPLWSPERKRENRSRSYMWTLTEMKAAAKAIGKTKEFNQWNRKRIEDERCANK